MGCSTCGQQGVTPEPYQFKYHPHIQTPVDPPVDENCEYTTSQLNVWLSKLICCKDTGLYVTLKIKASTLNKYLGIVGSAINYKSHPCWFKKELDNIANIIIIIENSGKC
jgi:hypothetical protein